MYRLSGIEFNRTRQRNIFEITAVVDHQKCTTSWPLQYKVTGVCTLWVNFKQSDVEMSRQLVYSTEVRKQ